MGHLALSGRGEVRVSSGMIDALKNEPLTLILSPNKGRGKRRPKRLVII